MKDKEPDTKYIFEFGPDNFKIRLIIQLKKKPNLKPIENFLISMFILLLSTILIFGK